MESFLISRAVKLFSPGHRDVAGAKIPRDIIKYDYPPLLSEGGKNRGDGTRKSRSRNKTVRNSDRGEKKGRKKKKAGKGVSEKVGVVGESGE